MRLLHSDTCGSSSGARALRPPGSRSGRNQARSSDGRRTLLNSSTVGHDSHRSPTGPPAREIFAVLSALFHKRRIRHGAHPYFHFLGVGPFSSARGPERDRPIPPQSTERSEKATIRSKISRSDIMKTMWLVMQRCTHDYFTQQKLITGTKTIILEIVSKLML